MLSFHTYNNKDVGTILPTIHAHKALQTQTYMHFKVN